MLQKLRRTMEVINKLKALPTSERKWVLDTTVKLAQRHRQLAEQRFAISSPVDKLQHHTRMQTLDVVLELLYSIPL